MIDDAYKEYLESAEWREKRQKRLLMDGYRCRFCGTRLNLQVHHKTYAKGLGEEDVGLDLITLCKDCHFLLHSVTDQFKEASDKVKESYKETCKEKLMPVIEDYNRRSGSLLAMAAHVIETERKCPPGNMVTVTSLIKNNLDLTPSMWHISAFSKPSSYEHAMQILKKWRAK